MGKFLQSPTLKNHLQLEMVLVFSPNLSIPNPINSGLPAHRF
jgi:hypothetical protein